MLAGRHIRTLINAELANTYNESTLNRVVTNVQAELTKRITRERVIRNMLDTHFIINDNKKNRIVTLLTSTLNGQPVSRNSIKQKIPANYYNLVLKPNGKYQVSEKSQTQRLGELNKYIFNSGNVRNALMKNMNSSGTKLSNVNRYLVSSTKYNVRNVNGKKFVKFKNVPPPAPTVTKKNANNGLNRALETTAFILSRHLNTTKTTQEMKKLRRNLAALKSGGQKALTQVQRNLEASKRNAIQAKALAASLQRNKNASNAERQAASEAAVREATLLTAQLEAARAAGVASFTDLQQAQANLATARANANRQRKEHQDAYDSAVAQAELTVTRLKANLAQNKNASATQIRSLSAQINAAERNKKEALEAQQSAHNQALAAAKAEKNSAKKQLLEASKLKTTSDAELIRLKYAIAKHTAEIQARNKSHANQLATVQQNLATHKTRLNNAAKNLNEARAAAAAAQNASATEKSAIQQKLNAAIAAHTLAIQVAKTNKIAALVLKENIHKAALAAEKEAKNTAQAATQAANAARNAAIQNKAAAQAAASAARQEAANARTALGKARALESAVINAAGKAVGTAGHVLGTAGGITRHVLGAAGGLARAAARRASNPTPAAPAVIGFGSSASTGRSNRYTLGGLIRVLNSIEQSTRASPYKKMRYETLSQNIQRNANKNVKMGRINEYIRRLPAN
jgi:hypothetical protein